MLLHLPGITIQNARKVMNSCDSIAELACLSREKMKEILGPLAGQKLFTFFHQVPTEKKIRNRYVHLLQP